MLHLGLAAIIIGVLLFMLPMAFNKWESLIEIGFLVFCAGCVIGVIGAVITIY